MKCFSLFSGIGGFDLAMTNLGHKIVGACEIDKHARGIYTRHFPTVPIWSDATKIIPDKLPEFDVLFCGFPCQPFSTAGKGQGFEDTRGTLFFEIIRIAREKQPSILFLENVKGLLSHDKGKTFGRIQSALYAVGYDCQWLCYNSKFDTAQNRQRIFIIANLRGKSGRKIFPITDFVQPSIHTQIDEQIDRKIKYGTYDKDGVTVLEERDTEGIDVIGGMGTLTSQKGKVYSADGKSPTISAGSHGYSNGYVMIRPESNYFETGGIDPKFVEIGVDGFLNMLAVSSGLSKKEYQDEFWDLLLSLEKKWTPKTDKLFRLLPCSDFIKDTRPNRIRRITPTECERLQGFEDGWTDGQSDTQRYKQLGNAVSVPIVQDIAKQVFQN